ncbi:L-aspartate oxidase [Beijerinckia indica]|uniref:L-aspartate oxidase n=1 Tax=Beijerinckia indica subsp. indica (strain ATCC 9039 / DSM 1715 / NCIMB 8712) TaxID=395963 RepID=B2IFF0_BEII9|nr:L-aspartate oxidase [Beijerinckia indica]ACB97050.1 L-aspartate oxidase [Beijerinckia indica subsp. indica ATCC 9039]
MTQSRMTEFHDVGGAPIIIGGGIAGLMTALTLAPRPVVLLAKSPLGHEASSVLAQGGVAVSLDADDSVDLHLADTLAAGDGLCDAAAARAILAAGPAMIEELVRLGVPFDRDAKGELALGLEAAHSRRRIVHAGGDSTGHAIVKTLMARIQATPSVTLIERVAARRILVEDGGVVGVLANTHCGPVVFPTDKVIIATGGIGALYEYGTNPAGSFGQGLALAARAGAIMGDLEFVQFHPTALDSDSFPLKLISEAVRGEGAILVDEQGHRFMSGVPGGELAPRDVVARAVWKQMQAGHKVFLDAREKPGVDFPKRFPAVTALCKAAGIDPVRQPIPIRPAAHYHMGGIKVDGSGRSSIDGLWACGEAACTGLHGANRLASNSLLEAAVCGRRVAEDIAGGKIKGKSLLRARAERQANAVPAPGPSDPALVRPIVSRGIGVLRDAQGLREAIADLYPLATGETPASDAATVGLMIAVAALRREESRGAHMRTDFPNHASEARRTSLCLEDALAQARENLPEPVV